jgi:tetratricopeptide (TPR) repeat protein
MKTILNMQKFSFHIIAATVSMVLLITSCEKKLDVVSPQDIPASEVVASDENVKSALVGAYDAVSDNSLLGGDLQLYSELLAANGEIFWTGTYNQPREIFLKQILVTNSYVRATYDNAYKAINICNTILSALDVVNEKDRDRVQGEALFLRGLMYFELVEFFAKPYSAGNVTTNPGLQLITTPTKGSDLSDANYVARSSVQETYDLIVSDLTKADSLLPEENGVYANRYASAAVLSRVYLQMANYEKARDEANKIIAANEFSLTKGFAEAFNNSSNSAEDLFAIQVSDQDGDNDMQLFFSPIENGGRGDVEILAKEMDQYENGDARKGLYYLDADSVYRNGKWKVQYKNLPIIRLAEMYLTRAECNFRLDTTVGATPFEDIQTIRSRAGLTIDLSFITLDNILLERKRELEEEGQDIQDRKRLKQTVDGYAYDANELVLPIPQREIDASNGALTQNDGY